MVRIISVSVAIFVLAGASLLIAKSGHNHDCHKEHGAGQVSKIDQKTCPVMGGEIDSTLYADHKGTRVYFCCAGCETQFKADPGAYLKKLNDSGQKAQSLPSETSLSEQTTCPVMGGAINKEIYADHDGKRVYFCCPGCIDTFKADPVQYLEKLKEMGQKPTTVG